MPPPVYSFLLSGFLLVVKKQQGTILRNKVKVKQYDQVFSEADVT